MQNNNHCGGVYTTAPNSTQVASHTGPSGREGRTEGGVTSSTPADDRPDSSATIPPSGESQHPYKQAAVTDDDAGKYETQPVEDKRPQVTTTLDMWCRHSGATNQALDQRITTQLRRDATSPSASGAPPQSVASPRPTPQTRATPCTTAWLTQGHNWTCQWCQGRFDGQLREGPPARAPQKWCKGCKQTRNLTSSVCTRCSNEWRYCDCPHHVLRNPVRPSLLTPSRGLLIIAKPASTGRGKRRMEPTAPSTR